MKSARIRPKAEETAARIYDAALNLFRAKGFEATTMRDIAENAQVATGAAYYYYPSKDAIVLDYYERSSRDMHDKIQAALQPVKSLDSALQAIIGVKFSHFAENREILQALLRNGADPKHPLSPFSAETKHIRDADIAGFAQAIGQSGLRVPADLAPHMPGLLWFFQMGLIFFWLIDDSPSQAKTHKLVPLATKVVTSLARFSTVPLLRPLRKPILQMVEIIQGGGDR